ncbi:GlxA family transcriptional regulator [Aliamphritea hakodatensis]|uniref:GlxA family transcriptional regulator n=1 Tax=Aliamphritea hakodatensis TaxID=2895352 RepID=UPI0022FD6FE6|nr:GlxA family transcriptional regulator [Aliamphritea hakodatensis]
MNTLSRHPGEPVTTVSKQISFILLPGFALTSFSLAIEALSVANSLDDQPIYSYGICSLTDGDHPGKVISSNGVPVEVSHGLDACDNAEMVFICAYKGAATIEDPQLLSQLRRLSQKGVRIVALSGGSFVLAKAGLLQDKGCTLVHEHRSTFAELYPSIPLQDSIYTVNGNVLTSAGGTATLDMLLYLIGLDQGKTFAHNVAQRFQQERIRSGEEVLASQRMLALSMKSPCLGAAIELMEKSIDQPYSIEDLSQRIGTTRRNLEMVFQRHQNTTPNRYYLKLRLQHARRMLEETNLSIASIAQATGFSSQSYFGKCFKDLYDIQPSQLRQD